jgi:UPF0716 protein FxsA
MNIFPLFLLLFLAVPLVEIFLLIQVGSVIGAGWTVLLVVVTAVIGVNLLRMQGISTLRRVQEEAMRGELPAVSMLEGLVLLFAGALLLTPGFFTDALGFLLLIPGLRRWWIIHGLQRYFQVRSARTQAGRPEQGRTIDAESWHEDDQDRLR